MSVGKSLYNYIFRPLPQAGAMQYAFEPRFELPIITLPGPATPYSFVWRITQPEQMYYNQAQVMDGKAGVVAGQIALQGLLDTRGING